MTSHSKPYGDIVDGFYVDSKKRKWQCTLVVGKWTGGKEFDFEVEMKTAAEEKKVSPGQFREFVSKKSLIKL